MNEARTLTNHRRFCVREISDVWDITLALVRSCGREMGEEGDKRQK